MSASTDKAQSRDIARVYQIVSWVFTLLVLTQAILAGRGWFIDFSLIHLHGLVGDALFFVAVGLVVLAWIGFPPGRERTTQLVISATLFVLTFTQVMLGFTATSNPPSATAAALHIPLGVLIFGFSCAVNARLWGYGRQSAAERR